MMEHIGWGRWGYRESGRGSVWMKRGGLVGGYCRWYRDRNLPTTSGTVSRTVSWNWIWSLLEFRSRNRAYGAWTLASTCGRDGEGHNRRSTGASKTPNNTMSASVGCWTPLDPGKSTIFTTLQTERSDCIFAFETT